MTGAGAEQSGAGAVRVGATQETRSAREVGLVAAATLAVIAPLAVVLAMLDTWAEGRLRAFAAVAIVVAVSVRWGALRRWAVGLGWVAVAVSVGGWAGVAVATGTVVWGVVVVAVLGRVAGRFEGQRPSVTSSVASDLVRRLIDPVRPAVAWLFEASPASTAPASGDIEAEEDDDGARPGRVASGTEPPERSSGVHRSRWAGSWFPIMTWGVALVVVNVVLVIDRWVTRGPNGSAGWRDLVLAGKQAWDTPITLRVAESGYGQGGGEEAVFPGYPLALRALEGPFGSAPLAGVAITLVGGLAAVLLFWAWMGERGVADATRRTSLLVFVLYPYSFLLFGTVYSDAAALALVLGSLVLAERRRWVAAGLVGAVATFTRPNALVLIPVLVVLALEQSGSLRVAWPPWRVWYERGRLRASSLGGLLSVGGVAAYAWWLQRDRGDALYMLRVQEKPWSEGGWDHGSILHLTTWTKVEFFATLRTQLADPWLLAIEVATAAIVVVAVVLIPAVVRRFGLAYGLLVLGLVAVVQAQKAAWTPGARLLLPAFPIAVVVGEHLARRPRLAWLVLSTSGTVMLVAAVAFGRGRAFW